MHPLIEKLYEVARSNEPISKEKLCEVKGIIHNVIPALNKFIKKEADYLKEINQSNFDIKLEIPQEINIDMANDNDVTLLASAASYNHQELVEILIEAGADLNHRDNEGETALMCAIEQRAIEVAKILAEAKADLNVMNNKGMTALDLAIANRDLYAINVLLNYGAIGNTHDLWAFLKSCDQRDPDVLSSILILYQEQKNIREGRCSAVGLTEKLEDNSYIYLEKCAEKLIYLEKLVVWTDEGRKEILNIVDENISVQMPDSDAKKRMPKELLHTVLDYSYPSLSGLSFFNAYGIDTQFSNVCLSLLKKKQEPSIDDPFGLSKKNKFSQ